MKLQNRSYTVQEDRLNVISHALGAVISALLFFFLMGKTQGIVGILANGFYGIAVLMMFFVSSTYHASKKVKHRDLLRRFDHAYIFILILATYTPIVFLEIQTREAYILYSVLFVMTVIGVGFKLYFSHRFKRIVTILFVVMGWLSVLLIPTIVASGNLHLMGWLLAGGVIYTVGAIVYIFGQFKYYHFVWHLFVLGGAFAHYIAILYYV